jgi:two-component system sensor histidine kinase AlgZ
VYRTNGAHRLPATPDSENRETQAYLPDFCAASTLFFVVLIVELVAIVLTLAANDTPDQFLIELSNMSLFVLWPALLGSAIMCQLRSKLEGTGKKQAFVLSFILLEVLCLALAEASYQLTKAFGLSLIIDEPHAIFMLRTFAISLIVIALMMRYLYISSEWRRSIVLEAQSRISALQALIRPHFLFNSMNTIASLTRSNPRQAEEAVEDLSDLLRANLADSGDRTTLKAELEVAAIYQRIEKLRLGDRLKVRWDVADLPMRTLIPSLTIQPLLENAIYHGVELLPDGGEVTVVGKCDEHYLSISISNPVAIGKRRAKDGNKMAMDNIRQRFELAYGNRATVEVEDTETTYTVRLRFPLDEKIA